MFTTFKRTHTTAFSDTARAASWYGGNVIEGEAAKIVHQLLDGVHPSAVERVRVEIEVDGDPVPGLCAHRKIIGFSGGWECSSCGKIGAHASFEYADPLPRCSPAGRAACTYPECRGGTECHPRRG